MLATSTRHANLMRTFSMKIGGESHTRSQRSHFPDFRGFIPFRNEFPSEFKRLSESGDFYPRVIIEKQFSWDSFPLATVVMLVIDEFPGRF